MYVAALEHLPSAYEVPKKHMGMIFAPAIRQASYFFPHIPTEQLADTKWSGFIEYRDGNYYVDLLGRIVRDLLHEDHSVSD